MSAPDTAPKSFVALLSPSSEAAVLGLARSLGMVEDEWPWRFHGGKTRSFEGKLGARLVLSHATMFGGLALAVENDHEGLAARVREVAELTSVETLAARMSAATEPREVLDALLSLASAQTLAHHPPLPAFLAAVRQALEHESPAVRLAALRALALVQAEPALSLLEGRTDDDNPGLASWLEHYRGVLAEQAGGAEVASGDEDD